MKLATFWPTSGLLVVPGKFAPVGVIVWATTLTVMAWRSYGSLLLPRFEAPVCLTAAWMWMVPVKPEAGTTWRTLPETLKVALAGVSRAKPA